VAAVRARRIRDTRPATITTAGVLYSYGALCTLHLVRRDVNPIAQPMSYYAIGSHSWLMTSVFFIGALCSFALSIGLRRGMALSWRSRVGLFLLTLTGASLAMCGLFPTDTEGDDVPRTVTGALHDFGSSVLSPCAVSATFLLSGSFAKDGRWRAFHQPARALSFLIPFSVALSRIDALGLRFGGLLQRISGGLLFLWLLLAARRLQVLRRE
jgi:hypothetical protein